MYYEVYTFSIPYGMEIRAKKNTYFNIKIMIIFYIFIFRCFCLFPFRYCFSQICFYLCKKILLLLDKTRRKRVFFYFHFRWSTYESVCVFLTSLAMTESSKQQNGEQKKGAHETKHEKLRNNCSWRSFLSFFGCQKIFVQLRFVDLKPFFVVIFWRNGNNNAFFYCFGCWSDTTNAPPTPPHSTNFFFLC